MGMKTLANFEDNRIQNWERIHFKLINEFPQAHTDN